MRRRKKRRLPLNQVRKIIRLKHTAGLSLREISRALSVPRSTVSDYLQRFRMSDLKVANLATLTSEEIYAKLFNTEPLPPPSKVMPDFTMIHQELRRKHVTRQLLWEEYVAAHPDASTYRYSQFCELYQRYSKKLSVSMRQVHKAGEKTFIDYSGLTMPVINRNTGEINEAEIFIAALGAGGYTYAEASADQKKSSFIASHTRMFAFFGGVSEILIPDNLKSGVSKADWYEPDLNQTYQDMAEHYGCVIIPARPGKPKDKPKAELSVKLAQRWILAKLRHRRFFSVDELNEAIWELLPELNNRKIRKLGVSRYELYLKLDQPALLPLPEKPYVIRHFKHTRISLDYHVDVECAFYSVPYQLRQQEVDIRYSDTTVEIFHGNRKVAIHPRLHEVGAVSTDKSHMPASHRAYAEYSPSVIMQKAEAIGNSTKQLMEQILTHRPHPEQGFRSCLGILRVCAHIEDEIAEAVSGRMLLLECYTVKHFKSILKNKTYLKQLPVTGNTPDSVHENVRGRDYYQ